MTSEVSQSGLGEILSKGLGKEARNFQEQGGLPVQDPPTAGLVPVVGRRGVGANVRDSGTVLGVVEGGLSSPSAAAMVTARS